MRIFILLSLLVSTILISCKENKPPENNIQAKHKPADKTAEIQTPDNIWSHPGTQDREKERRQMVNYIRTTFGFNDSKALSALETVPRHWFMPEFVQRRAYWDSPQPIGWDQTISQPFIVAYMTHLLNLKEEDKVLEIGTGSGYQAAVLNEYTPNVYTIEIIEPLARRTIEVFKYHGYNNIKVKIGDGYKGWPQYAPFDAIIVTCAPDHIPPDLKTQLANGGKMVIPLGQQDGVQQLVLVTKDQDGQFKEQELMDVRFVPLVRDEGN